MSVFQEKAGCGEVRCGQGEGSSFGQTREASLWMPEPEDIKVTGFVGKRLDACLGNNVKPTDGQYLVSVFKSKAETWTWQTEFWGKWMHSAVPLVRYSGDGELRANLTASVQALLDTQREDGYLGNYSDEAQLNSNGGWDIWGRKYTILGLLHYYDLTRDETALSSACRVADHLMTQIETEGHDLYRTGNFRGMPSCSVLEAFLGLFRFRKDHRYLDFARYIVSQLEDPADSAKLISRALSGVDVASRFPHPANWWKWENGMKAYEMMSCYQGLLEFYQVSGDRKCLEAASAAAQNILATEINAAGSGSASECWFHGSDRETVPTYHMMETCVTITWLRLCGILLRLTRNPIYADAFEKTFFNAYLGALSRDASIFPKYTPLEGIRGRGEDQCGLHTNCCIANGPRGFVALLETMILAGDDAVFVNLYTRSRVTIAIPNTGNRITVEQDTDYPVGDTVTLSVAPDREAFFQLNLRIPAWSEASMVAVNGEQVADVRPGTYLAISRTWKTGDSVTLKLDMHGRSCTKNDHLVLERGPITLARDARFGDGDIDESVGALDVTQSVELIPVEAPTPDIWMAFTTKLQLGVNLETEEGRTPRPVHFCDFASSGNTWNEESRYRVWLQQSLNVMQSPYVPY